MHLNIITPEQTLFDGDVKSVSLCGTDGKFQILDRHAPIISALAKGEIRIVDADDRQLSFEIKGGLLEMSKNRIQILAS